MKKNISLVAFLFATLFTMSFVMQDEWFLCEAKSCKIYFPKKPTDTIQTLTTAIGDLKLYMYMYEVPDSVNDDNVVYGLIETEYPDTTISSDNKKSTLDKFFKGTIDGAVNNVQGKLLSTTEIEYETYPGRAIKVDYQDGLAIVTMRMYLVKNRMYMLQTVTETKNEPNASIEKFMNSFRVRK